MKNILCPWRDVRSTIAQEKNWLACESKIPVKCATVLYQIQDEAGCAMHILPRPEIGRALWRNSFVLFIALIQNFAHRAKFCIRVINKTNEFDLKESQNHITRMSKVILEMTSGNIACSLLLPLGKMFYHRKKKNLS